MLPDLSITSRSCTCVWDAPKREAPQIGERSARAGIAHERDDAVARLRVRIAEVIAGIGLIAAVMLRCRV